MSAFESGRRFYTPRKRSLAINVAPLIDVLFLLLIFLLVSTTFKLRPALRVELPRAPGREGKPVEKVALTIAKDGAYYVDGKPASARNLQKRLREIRGTRPRDAVDVEVDRAAPSEALVFALDAARAAGYKQVSMPTVRIGEDGRNAGR